MTYKRFHYLLFTKFHTTYKAIGCIFILFILTSSCGDPIEQGAIVNPHILHGIYVSIHTTGYEQIVERYQFQAAQDTDPTGNFVHSTETSVLDPANSGQLISTQETISGTYTYVETEPVTFEYPNREPEIVPVKSIILEETAFSTTDPDALITSETYKNKRYIYSIYVDEEKLMLGSYNYTEWTDTENPPPYNVLEAYQPLIEGMWQARVDMQMKLSDDSWQSQQKRKETYSFYDTGKFTWELQTSVIGLPPTTQKKPVGDTDPLPMYVWEGKAGLSLDGVTQPFYYANDALLMDETLFYRE